MLKFKIIIKKKYFKVISIYVKNVKTLNCNYLHISLCLRTLYFKINLIKKEFVREFNSKSIVKILF